MELLAKMCSLLQTGTVLQTWQIATESLKAENLTMKLNETLAELETAKTKMVSQCLPGTGEFSLQHKITMPC